MNAVQAVVLGAVQGVTEFLPISSTAHLRIVPAFLGWSDPGAAFTAVTQLGTTLGVLIYFRRDLARILVTWFRSLTDPALRGELDARLGWYIGIGTIPIGVFGLAFKDQIENEARNLYLIGGALVVIGLVLYLAERVGTRERSLETVTARDAAFVGLAQAAALVPGVSRAGSTISAGLFRGLERPAAARYSFLLSIPAIVLSGLLEISHIGDGDGPGPVATVIATVIAFVVGYASIAWLLRYLATHSTTVFVVYRVVLGLVVLGLTATGVIS